MWIYRLHCSEFELQGAGEEQKETAYSVANSFQRFLLTLRPQVALHLIVTYMCFCTKNQPLVLLLAYFLMP